MATISDTNKVIELIRNCLALAGNNPNEHEAMSAALKAQALMAKYNIDIAQVQDEQNIREEITREYCVKGTGVSKWQNTLAGIISKNFRVKFYLYGRDIVFYGYKTDVKIAKEVFTYLAEQGNKLATKLYNKVKAYGGYTKGVMNSYLMGFVKGISDVLERQCVALMIVTPQEVQDSFDEMTSNWRTVQTRIRFNDNSQYYENGRNDGRSLANSRAIEG